MKQFITRLILQIFVVTFSLSSFISCSSEDDEEPIVEEQPIIFPSGIIPKPIMSETGGATIVEFIAPTTWTVAISDNVHSTNWIEVSPTSGSAGNVKLQIIAKENSTYDERNASITLISGTSKQIFTVTQKQKDALTVTSNKVELDAEGGEFSIEVKSNVSYEYVIDKSCENWINIVETRGLTTSTLKFKASTNESIDKREGVIIIKSDKFEEIINVYQNGEIPNLIISQDEYLVGSAGEVVKVELQSNVNYELQMPMVDWINEATTRSMSSYTHFFEILPNEDYDGRTSKIVFLNKERNVSDTITINQVQKDAIIVAQNEYNVSEDENIIDFFVNTNVNFEVSLSVDWIIQNSDTRALQEKALSFTISANDTEEIRVGEILIANDDLEQKIIVKQSAKKRPHRTILAYVVADNSLASFAKDDLSEMLEGMQYVDCEINNLLVYFDGTSNPSLFRFAKNDKGEVLKETIEEYDEQNSTSPSVMSNVVKQVFDNFPAESYGLIYWSHGEGWKPMPESSTRWIGQDKGGNSTDYMNIDELKKSLTYVPHLDFLFFDACFMMSVEVAYELYTETDYIIASPNEIPGPGAPYDVIIPEMFKKGDVAIEVAKSYYNVYNKLYNNGIGNSDYNWTAGTSIGVLKTCNFEAFAEKTNKVLENINFVDIKSLKSNVLDYDKRSQSSSSRIGYYDMAQLIRTLCNDNSYAAWKTAFDDVMVYYQTTPNNYSVYTGMFSMDGANGLSHYLPTEKISLDKAYFTTKWFPIVGHSLWNTPQKYNETKKWYAGIVERTPTTFGEIRILDNSDYYMGAGSYSFPIGNWRKFVICIPSGSITKLTLTAYPGNFVEDRYTCKEIEPIVLKNSDGSLLADFRVWLIETEGINDPDTFTFVTIE